MFDILKVAESDKKKKSSKKSKSKKSRDKEDEDEEESQITKGGGEHHIAISISLTWCIFDHTAYLADTLSAHPELFPEASSDTSSLNAPCKNALLVPSPSPTVNQSPSLVARSTQGVSQSNLGRPVQVSPSSHMRSFLSSCFFFSFLSFSLFLFPHAIFFRCGCDWGHLVGSWRATRLPS